MSLYFFASITGAWIETSSLGIDVAQNLIRVHHGRVDWNIDNDYGVMKEAIRVHHGRVDWNNNLLIIILKKYFASITGAWIETCNIPVANISGTPAFASITGAWIETNLHRKPKLVNKTFAPSRLRGLKPHNSSILWWFVDLPWYGKDYHSVQYRF